MNGKEDRQYNIFVRKEDYISFVIYEKADEDLLERIASQEHSGDIVCLVDVPTWQRFLLTPNDPTVADAVRTFMASEYQRRQPGKDPRVMETMKSHILDRLGEQVHEYEAEVRTIRKVMVEVEVTHDVSDLIPHLIREFGMDRSRPIDKIVEQVLFLLHPELFE